MMRTSSLLPSGSPFGDFGPHQDSLQFLFPIFFHSPPFFSLYFIDFKLIAHNNQFVKNTLLSPHFHRLKSLLFGKIQFRNDLLTMIFFIKFNSKNYSFSSFQPNSIQKFIHILVFQQNSIQKIIQLTFF